jgi:hypothetical protein
MADVTAIQTAPAAPEAKQAPAAAAAQAPAPAAPAKPAANPAPVAAEAAKAEPNKPEAPAKGTLLVDAEGDKPKAPDGAPESPEGDGKAAEAPLTLKLPEGSLLPAERVEKIAAFAKARGLSQEQAQAVLESEDEAVLTFAERQQATHLKAVNDWVEVVKKDPQVGGEKFEESAKFAKQAVNRFASAELKQLLNATGFGNHPELFKMFRAIGEAMQGDRVVLPSAATQSAPKQRTLEDLFDDAEVLKMKGGAE